MADRATKEVLLRLRRAHEVELRRALVVTRAARAEARRTGAATEAARRALESAFSRAHEARTRRWVARSAGRLVRATDFERGLRDVLSAARAVEHKAILALDAAEARLRQAQHALAEAVHARQRSESLAMSERAVDRRARERREQSELEDRYRPSARAARHEKARSKV
jgi:hypothetical protein